MENNITILHHNTSTLILQYIIRQGNVPDPCIENFFNSQLTLIYQNFLDVLCYWLTCTKLSNIVSLSLIKFADFYRFTRCIVHSQNTVKLAPVIPIFTFNWQFIVTYVSLTVGYRRKQLTHFPLGFLFRTTGRSFSNIVEDDRSIAFQTIHQDFGYEVLIRDILKGNFNIYRCNQW